MMKKIPVGVQLWSVRDDVAKDTADTLKRLKAMGYECVELAGLGAHSAPAWKAMLADNGLSIEGAHVGIDAIAPGAIRQTLETYATIGCRRLVVPGLPHDLTSTLDGYRRVCSRMNIASETFVAAGMRLGYHNHDFEFRFLENRVPYELMADMLISDVFLQYDFGWLYKAGIDGVAYTKARPGRIPTPHIKAYQPGEETAVVGADSVPWKDVFKVCRDVGGTEAFIVEHEHYAAPPMECVRQCLENVRKIGD